MGEVRLGYKVIMASAGRKSFNAATRCLNGFTPRERFQLIR